MDDADLRLRNHVYRRFVELGRAPMFDELAAELDLSPGEIEPAMRRLHDAHALVLEADVSRIQMAHPFSEIPTPHRVHENDRWWYANCAWDAFGILAALGVDGHVASSCPDCAEPVEITVLARSRWTTTTSCTSTCPPRSGGTTSSSPEAR